MKSCIVAAAILISLTASTSLAANGDVRHVISHDRVKVVTDPSKGSNAYRQWAVFPAAPIQHRRAILWITYACPDSLRCGEWDYIDNIWLRRIGGQGQVSRDIEIARMISPYGWRFGPDWRFTWHIDITDFGFLLRDSVEVEFNHTGYESNTDRGWLITLDFELTEGRPAIEILGMDTLWSGSIPFGDSTRPIEEILAPREFVNRVGADFVRLRITQTGHGMDDAENCAEFCSKYRRVIFDGKEIDKRQLWRECGDNPLYPQAGTWIFDRANWCPGAVVYPDVYDLPVAIDGRHVIDIEMEPYINRSKPTTNYFLHSYLFYCAKPWAFHDVSLEEILAPSERDEYSRFNPICSQQRIRVKNSGREPVTKLSIRYGWESAHLSSMIWEGRIESQQTEVITLPAEIPRRFETMPFFVEIVQPSDQVDEYPFDNRRESVAVRAPVYNADIVLSLRTNADTAQTSVVINDHFGRPVFEKPAASLEVNTLYEDTIQLQEGCYELVVADTMGDGLDFWFNPEGGFGYVRLLSTTGQLLKAFPSDFGSELRHSFRVANTGMTEIAPDSLLPLVNLFPIRNPGKFNVDLFFNSPRPVVLKVLNADSSRIVLENSYADIKEAFLPLDISSEPDGFYVLHVIADGRTIAKRFRVRRD